MNTRQKLYRLSLILLFGCVYVLTLPTLACSGEASELLRVRRGFHKTALGDFTRVVFDVKGERPTKIEPLPPDKVVITFGELRTRSEPQIQVTEAVSTVSAIKILDAANGSQVLVQFRTPGCVVSHSILPPEKPDPGTYRLVVDVLPPTKGKAPKSGANDPNPPSSLPTKPAAPPPVENSVSKPKPSTNSEAKPGEATIPQPPPATTTSAASGYREVTEASLSEPLQQANRLLAERDFEKANAEYTRLLKEPGLSKDEVAVASYGLADSYYYLHQDALATVAKGIANNYLLAIKADPSLIQAGWAYYRLGLAYLASGSRDKASKAFQKPLQDYPRHPVAPLCWLELGACYNQAGSYPQAVRALHAALGLPLNQSQKIRAQWLLGVALYGTGEYLPASEALERCLTEEPDYYLSQPLILKYLGDSYFFQKEYDKSRDLLLWYLNLQPDEPNRALVLAKMAEIFSAQEEPDFAQKLFELIQNSYPDTEGDIIAQIRKMEVLKSRGKLTPEDDLSFFRELAQKPIPVQLTKLVHLRLASREHEYGNFDASLSVIDYNLQDSRQAASNAEFLALRPRVITDWLKSAYQNHDYNLVIMLYEKDQNAFADADSEAFQRMIADSYAGVNQYQKAILLYEQILDKVAPAAGDLALKAAELAFQIQDMERSESLCERIQGAQWEVGKKLLMARIAYLKQRYDKVVQCLSSLPETEIPATNSPSMSSIYGESLAQLGECDKAHHWLQKASEQMEKTDTHSDELVHCFLTQAACYSKGEKHDQAIAVLEEASTIAGTEDLRDRLQYDISKRYLDLGQTDKAIEILTKLTSSNQSFWQTAAKQQLNYLQMERN